MGPAALIYVLEGLLLIPGIIFGRMGLKSLGDDIKSKALGVLLIIFTGIVPGILFLCWTPDSEAVIKPKVKLDVDTKTDFKVGDKVMVMQENGEETTEVPGVISGYDYSLKIYTISLEGDKKTYASARKIKKAK